MSEAAPAVSSAESRIDRRFAALRAKGRAGLVTFVTAGDPDRETATEILRARPEGPDFGQRWPWLVAFIFGLLHGFGFAGALREIGLLQ